MEFTYQLARLDSRITLQWMLQPGVWQTKKKASPSLQHEIKFLFLNIQDTGSFDIYIFTGVT